MGAGKEFRAQLSAELVATLNQWREALEANSAALNENTQAIRQLRIGSGERQPDGLPCFCGDPVPTRHYHGWAPANEPGQ